MYHELLVRDVGARVRCHHDSSDRRDNSWSQLKLDHLVDIYPNPTNDLFFIAAQNLKIEQVRIYSATGQLKDFSKPSDPSFEFSTHGLASGIYFVEILTEQGVVVKKLNVR